MGRLIVVVGAQYLRGWVRCAPVLTSDRSEARRYKRADIANENVERLSVLGFAGARMEVVDG